MMMMKIVIIIIIIIILIIIIMFYRALINVYRGFHSGNFRFNEHPVI